MATHPCFAPRVLAPLVTLAALAAPSHAGDPQRLDIIFVADPLLDRVYELRDWNLNGTWGDAPDCEVLYESTQGAELLVEPVAVTADPDDAVYVGDAARDVVLYMNDLDGDGDLNDAGEASVYFNGAAGGNASGVRMARVRNLDMGGWRSLGHSATAAQARSMRAAARRWTPPPEFGHHDGRRRTVPPRSGRS